jgi:hypothetical protein
MNLGLQRINKYDSPRRDLVVGGMILKIPPTPLSFVHNEIPRVCLDVLLYHYRSRTMNIEVREACSFMLHQVSRHGVTWF